MRGWNEAAMLLCMTESQEKERGKELREGERCDGKIGRETRDVVGDGRSKKSKLGKLWEILGRSLQWPPGYGERTVRSGPKRGRAKWGKGLGGPGFWLVGGSCDWPGASQCGNGTKYLCCSVRSMHGGRSS